MLQTGAPNPLEDAGPHPGLEAQMARAPGTVLGRNHLPLATRAQNIEDAVEHGAVRYPWPTIGPGRFVGRQDGFDPVPQVFGNLAESIPLFRFPTHRTSSNDVTMLLSALANRKREGF